VIPALNRDETPFSDLVMQMFGTIAGRESVLLVRRIRQGHGW
jgi:hypothetical protein